MITRCLGFGAVLLLSPAEIDEPADDPLVLHEVVRQLHEVRRARAELTTRAAAPRSERATRRAPEHRAPHAAPSPTPQPLAPLPCTAGDADVIEALRALRTRVEAGIPYRRDERLRATDGLLAGLEDPSACHTLWSSARVSGLVTLLREELRLGQSVERFEAPVALEDGALRLHADQLRLGLRAQYFIERDAPGDPRIGKVQAREDAPQPWTLVDDPAERAAIAAAFGAAIPAATQPFVALPLPQAAPDAAEEAT